MCNRWAGEPCEKEGHAGPEAGETGEAGEGAGRSGEPGRHELAEQGTVGGCEEQDQQHAHKVKNMLAKL